MAQKYDEQLKQLTLVENEIDRLKSLYDRYFAGTERIEPTFLRKRIDRILRNREWERIRNSVVQFRFRTVSQRFYTYSAHWDRMNRMLEDGRLRRDGPRASLASHPVMRRRFERVMAARASTDETTVPLRELTGVVGDAPGAAASDDEPTVVEARAGRTAASGRPAAPVLEGNDAAEEPRLRSLYTEYVDAKRRNGDNIERVSFRGFVRSIMRTRDAQLVRFGCDELDYSVRVRDGKVAVVAHPADPPNAEA